MNTVDYWNERYREGLGAGRGSQGDLYRFKLEVVQDIVNRYGVQSVVDVGCGDGSQLFSLDVGHYHGMDISDVAIDMASQHATEDRVYQVMNAGAVAKERIADMSISLNVISFLPDDQYEAHMDLLFALARRYVLIYAPNREKGNLRLADHIYFREFAGDVPAPWKLLEHIPNDYPAEKFGLSGSFSGFYLYEKPKKRKSAKKTE